MSPKSRSVPLDPDLIRIADTMGRVIISLDAQTLPGHLAEHLAAGGSSAGIFILRRPLNISVANDLVLIAFASEPEEWRDRFAFVPL